MVRTVIAMLATSTLSFAAGTGGSAQSIDRGSPPPSRTVEHSDSYGGVTVSDPYRWLENIGSDEVEQWARAQNDYTERLTQTGLAERMARILSYSDQITIRQYTAADDRKFYLRGHAGSPYQGLHVEERSGETRFLAGREFAEDGTVTDASRSVSAFWPSPDGRYVLAFTSPQQQAWGEYELIDVDSGEILARHLGQSGIAAATWLADGSTYAYAAYDRDGDTPVRGRIILARPDGTNREILPAPDGEEGRTRIVAPFAAQDSNRVFVDVATGSSGIRDVYSIDLDAADTAPVRLTNGGGAWLFIGALGDHAWIYTNVDAPNGRIVRFDMSTHPFVAETVVAEGGGAMGAGSQVGGDAYGMFGDRIAMLYRDDAVPLVRIFDLDGNQTGQIEIPPTGSVWSGFVGDITQPELYYQFLGVAEPASIYRLDLHSGESERIVQADTPFAPSDIVARRIFVPRPDGARVPVIIAHRADADMTRPHRLMMYGYGAFGWVSFLWYQPQVVDWILNDGGIFAVAGVRGGGEFGTDWHEAGRKLNRQTAIDDYMAVVEHLVDRGITTRDLFVANSSSAAGNIVGAALNQNPDYFGAAVIDFPVLDLLRYPEFGRAHFWKDEIGSPSDPAEFAVLRRISPYHNIRPGTCYSPTIVRTGEHDETVTPMHGFKFIARLQAAQTCDNPVLLDVMENAGHNHGAQPEDIAHNHAVMLEFLDTVLSDHEH